MAGSGPRLWRAGALVAAAVLVALTATGPGAEAQATGAATIESVTPNVGNADEAHRVVIRGSGFAPSGTVRFDGEVLDHELVSSTKLVATVPPGDPGSAHVRVVTPAGWSATSASSRFVRVRPPVVAVTPSTLPLQGGAIEIRGVGLAPVASVLIDGTSVPFEVVSPRRIRATVPAGDAGPVGVAVRTSDGLVGRAEYGEVGRVAAPIISVVTPGTGSSAGGGLVAIRGFGLAGVTDVRFDGLAATIESVEMTEIVVRPPAHEPGPVDVDVTGPGGTNDHTGSATYTYADGHELHATAIDAANQHSCAVTIGGDVACWGDDYYGQLGDGEIGGVTAAPTLVAGIDDADQISTAGRTTCARVDGTVWCWGQNIFGELGDGTTQDSPSPVQVVGITDAIDVDAGSWTTCAVLAGGSVECWGSFSPGFELDDALDVSVSGDRVCVLREGSLIQCIDKWEPEFEFTVTGAVSVNDTDDRVCVATQAGGTACRLPDGTIEQLPGVRAQDRGTRIVCSLDGEGQVTCTNLTWYGGVLDAPAVVPGIDDATDIALGDRHGCAVLTSGQVRCWGDGSVGQVGDGSHGTATPAPSIPGMAATDVASSTGAAACAMVGGEAYCWGEIDGYSHAAPAFDEPIWIEGLAGARALAVGELHVCGLMAGGRVRCGGYNAYGVLGNGTEVSPPPSWNPNHVSAPAFVPRLRHVEQLTAAGMHTCAARADGAVFCWGLTFVGSDQWQLRPRRIEGVAAPTALAAGFGRQTCAVASASVSCWGSFAAPDAVAISGLSDPVDVAAGNAHNCAIVPDGGVWCWGMNDYGQLGDGTRGDSAEAVAVNGIDDAIDVALAYQSSCVAREDGSVWCWGRRADGTSRYDPAPVQLAGLTNVVRIVGGPYVTALRNDGSVATWNGTESAGLGHLTGHRIPVTVRCHCGTGR